jgi:hypothetical protein
MEAIRAITPTTTPSPPMASRVTIPMATSPLPLTIATIPSRIDAFDGVADRALAFAISTPGDPSGQFYDIHMHKPGYEDWYTKHVTVDDAIRAGRISREWVEQRARQWGITSSIYQNRVLGEFADESEEGIIPLSHVRAAIERWRIWRDHKFLGTSGKQTLGIDVARAGADKTVVAERIGSGIKNLHQYSKLSIAYLAGIIKTMAQGRELHIETDGGLGASLFDFLRDEEVPNLRPITVGSSTLWRDKSKELKFANIRAAMWWNMRELLDPVTGEDIMLPPVDGLILDLTTPQWEIKKDGVVFLEPKITIIERLGRSTDYGDSVCLAFWNTTSGGGVVF